MNFAFTLTPMSAPGSAARLALFRLTDTHCCCSTWGGSVFILVFRQECVPNAAVYLRLLVLWHDSIGSSFSPHTRHYILFSDFSLSPVFTAEDFGITALLRDRLLARSLLRLLIIIRPDTPIFLTGEQLACFSGLLCLASLLVSPDSLIPPLALCFQVLLLRLWSQPDKQRKLFNEEKVRFPTTSPTSYVSFFPLGNLC